MLKALVVLVPAVVLFLVLVVDLVLEQRARRRLYLPPPPLEPLLDLRGRLEQLDRRTVQPPEHVRRAPTRHP